MENDPMKSQSDRRANTRTWLWAALAALAVIVIFLAYRSYEERRQREAALGAMVTAFQKQNSLSVFRAQVPVFVSNSDSRLFGLLRSEQIGVIPATVEYRLDLSQLDDDSFKWDEDRQLMSVTIPPLTIGEPTLDAGRARLVNKGVLVTGDAAMNLMRKNMETARQSAAREARNPQMLELARSAAREMMTQNVVLPLRAAGFDEAQVTVRFPSEGTDEPSYLDRSLTYNQAIEEARRRRAAEGQR